MGIPYQSHLSSGFPISQPVRMSRGARHTFHPYHFQNWPTKVLKFSLITFWLSNPILLHTFLAPGTNQPVVSKQNSVAAYCIISIVIRV